MSALPPKADMCGATRDVRFVPIADMPSGNFDVLFAQWGMLGRQTTVPKSLPIPAVSAIANAPRMSLEPWHAEHLRRLLLPRLHLEVQKKAQRRSGHYRDKRPGGRYYDHEQGHGRTDRKRRGRGQCGLHGTRGGDFRNP